MIKRILPLLLLFILFTAKAYAAPNITGFIGDLTNSSVVTVSGTSFGTKTTAAPFKWDNYESGNLYDVYNSSDGIEINSGGVNQRANSSYNVKRLKSDNNAQSIKVDTGISSTDGYYTSFWAAHPSGSYTANNQIKHVRIYGSNGTYPNYNFGKHESGGDRQFVSIVEGAGGTDWHGNSTIYDDDAFHRIEVWFKPSTGIGQTDGAYKVWKDGSLDYERSNWQTDNGTSNDFNRLWWVWGYFLVAAGDGYLDDVTFDYTQSRVELGNASTWTTSTHREYQPPTAWADGEVTIIVNQGAFADDATVYLYVVDESGVVNESGFEIDFGGGSTAPTMSNVSNSTALQHAETETVTGTDFEAAQGTGLLQIMDDVSASATLTLDQTINTWADTSISFDVSTTGLSEGSTAYMKVTNNTGNTSADFQLTLYESPAAIPPAKTSMSIAGDGALVLGGTSKITQIEFE